ncbi:MULTISPECIES: hypothetical protein [unclassified Variovorax]|uniref:hypothetical protein n=1 Tax=unclassified Variovorax TaxID=663243 RepID=UPI00116016A9|nr:MULTISPECIES: hypothetical protein [unclassified Variovorax]
MKACGFSCNLFCRSGGPVKALVLSRRGRGRCTLAQRPGIVGAHVLRHETPFVAETTEQRIRNSADREADWVFVVLGYKAQVVQSFADAALSPAALRASGAAEGALSGLYTLSHSATPDDVAALNAL